MKAKYLLPHRFKLIGWLFFIPALVLGILQFGILEEPDFFNWKVLSLAEKDFVFGNDTSSKWVFFKVIENNVFDELISIVLLVGLLFIALAKQKVEDEFTMKLRLESILWAVLANAVLLVLAIAFIYDFMFFNIMIFNLFLTLILFVIRFHWVMFKHRAAE